MVVGVDYSHAQYLHGECMAAVFVSKSGGSHGFAKLHEACDLSLLQVQEGAAQRAATSAAVQQSIREEPWGHFPQKLPNRL